MNCNFDEVVLGHIPRITYSTIVFCHLLQVFEKLEGGKVLDLVDPRMEEALDGEILVRFFELAIQCAAPVRADRPDMKSVGEQLWGIRAEYHKRQRRGSRV